MSATRFEWDEPMIPNHVALLLRELQRLADDPCDQFDEDGWTWGTVRASQQQLADKIGRSRRQVRDQKATLVEAGWLRVEKTGGHNRDDVTTYAVRLTRGSAPPVVEP